MSYQAIIRDAGNVLVANQSVGVQVSILKGTINGNAVFAERHTLTTNINGLLSLEIGTGTVFFGAFNTIDWTDGPYFVKTETDPNGGINYTISGTSQLMSVPYAFHSKTADKLISNEPTGAIFNEDVQQFNTKIYNGVHPFYEVGSLHQMYNSGTQQIAIIGVSKDNHNPIDPNNDTRSLMVHNDAQRNLTKTMVLEPGELTMGVTNDSIAAAGGDPTQALIQMRDVDKEIVFANGYIHPNQKNMMILAGDETSFVFSDGSSFRVLKFSDAGIQLLKNNVQVWGIDMNGNTLP